MNYWIDLFTGETWKEFLDAGARVSGFRSSRWAVVQKVRKGDRLICYLTGVSRFVGMLEVTGEPYQDETPIWKQDVYPCRLPVHAIIALEPSFGVPIYDLRDQLSCFTESTSPHAWKGAVRGSPTRWSKTDGDAVFEALCYAKEHPRELPTDDRKLRRKPKAVLGRDKKAVIIPEDTEEEENTPAPEQEKPSTEHTEIQALLLRLGAEMGFDVWVARNDRGRISGGKALGDFPKVKKSLPLKFDEATNRTIELIDVLWLKGNSIIAAFEIESTTSIYSGLLRMSDLTAMQPNLNIPLYLVAPGDRRDKVLSEINRPTFSRLTPPLSNLCRYIAFEDLKKKIAQVGGYLRFIKPEFLEELSEDCSLEDQE